ncbi:hypothetical protein BH09MYX1_BH09MYX1_31760 [soil metagenome]
MDSRLRALLESFDALAPTLDARAEALRHELARALSAENLKIHSVTARTKARPSLEKKLARPDRSYAALWDVTDLVGLRVVTYFEDDVDRVGTLIERLLPVALEHSIDKRKVSDPSAFGYRSLHYVCRFGAASELPHEACFEIQVRTVLEHAWAEIEHDLGYKSPEVVPLPVRRRLHRIASLLELADEEFVGIRTSLDAYASSLPRRMEEEADSVPFDRLSLGSLVSGSAVSEADRAIAALVHCELGKEVFFPDYLLKLLAAAGLRTIGEARRALVAHESALTHLVHPYFAFAARTWGLSPQALGVLPRGYALFFLGHAVVLEGASLRIDKVDRLTRFYRALAYPDDERAAQRVASQLVDSFTAT